MQILFILFIGLFLRLIKLNQSLWLDEAIGALVAKERNLWDIIVNFPKGDTHPSFFYGLLKVWTDLVGFSETSMRIICVIAGVVTVYITYLISLQIFKNKTKASAAALLIASSPLHVYYSQELRMYVFTSLFASAAVYFFIKAYKYSKNIDFFIFSLCILLLGFTDYLPLFLLPVFWIVALSKLKEREWILKFIISHFPLVFFAIWWSPIFLYQSKAGKELIEKLPQWQNLTGGASLKQVVVLLMKIVIGRISYFNKAIYYSFVVIAWVPFAFALKNALKTISKHRILWLWLILPATLTFIVSIFIPAFSYFRLIFILPAFYILISEGVGNSKYSKIITGTILVVHLASLFLYYSDPKQQRENWRDAVSYIESVANPKDVAIFANPEPFAPFRWYSKGSLYAVGGTDSVGMDETKTIEKFDSATHGKEGIYYFRYLEEIMDPKKVVKRRIEQKYTLVSIVNFDGVGEVEYYQSK